jgi:hypothetical protein
MPVVRPLHNIRYSVTTARRNHAIRSEVPAIHDRRHVDDSGRNRSRQRGGAVSTAAHGERPDFAGPAAVMSGAQRHLLAVQHCQSTNGHGRRCRWSPPRPGRRANDVHPRCPQWWAVFTVTGKGTVNLRSCGRSANHISLIRHTRPGEPRRRTGENRPRITQVHSASRSANQVVSYRRSQIFADGLPIDAQRRRQLHLRAARMPVREQLDQIEHQDTSPRHQRPSIRQPTDAERTFQRGPHRADTPPRMGNYVTDNPSNLGKYVTADTQTTNDPLENDP